MAHIHADLMTQYAEDAAETDMPWERWEFCHMRGEYLSLHGHPEWVEDNEYRRKPKVILINGHEVPEPHRTPLEIDAVYWTFTFIEGGVINFYWKDDDIGTCCLKNGFIHLTKEAAEKHFNALKSFTAQEAK